MKRIKRSLHKQKICNKIIDKNLSIEFIRSLYEVSTKDGMNLIMTHKAPIDKKPIAPIMLLHGLGQNRYTWTQTRRSLENYLVYNGFETFNVELRGHGLSRANGSDYAKYFSTYLQYDMPALITEIYEIALGQKLFIIGHSLGGSISYCVGSEFNKYLRGIISIAGPFNMAEGNLLLKAIAKISVFLHKKLLFLVPVEPEVFFIDFIGVIAQHGLFLLDHPKNIVPLQVWYPGSIERDILIERIIKGFDRTSVNVIRFFFEWGAKGHFASVSGNIKYEEKIKDLKCPILFIAGDRDYAVPAESIQEAYEKSGSKDKVFKIFGGEEPDLHFGHIDLINGKKAPEIVWPYINKWLKDRI